MVPPSRFPPYHPTPHCTKTRDIISVRMCFKYSPKFHLHFWARPNITYLLHWKRYDIFLNLLTYFIYRSHKDSEYLRSWLNFGQQKMFLPKCSQDMYKICAPSVHLTKISFFWIYRSNYDATWNFFCQKFDLVPSRCTLAPPSRGRFVINHYRENW